MKMKKATVSFGGNLSVDGYELPSGEFRVGLSSASKLLGFESNWLSRTIDSLENQTIPLRRGKAIKALQGFGFKGYVLEGRVDRPDGNGASLVKTISLDDLALLILYGAISGKPPAIALQLALTKMSLVDFFRDAFKYRPLTLDEKRALFYSDYAKSIDWLEESRLEASEIEDQQRFLYPELYDEDGNAIYDF